MTARRGTRPGFRAPWRRRSSRSFRRTVLGCRILRLWQGHIIRLRDSSLWSSNHAVLKGFGILPELEIALPFALPKIALPPLFRSYSFCHDSSVGSQALCLVCKTRTARSGALSLFRTCTGFRVLGLGASSRPKSEVVNPEPLAPIPSTRPPLNFSTLQTAEAR